MNSLTNTTKTNPWYLAAALAVLLFPAACGSDSEPASDARKPPAVSETDEPITTRAVDDVGTILVDADGKTLYTNEAESDGTIKCVEGCADFWPPLEGSESSLPSAVEGIDGEFGVIERADGVEQVTLDGQPLYTFAEDRTPGSVQGDGFEDDFQGEHFVWHVVTADGPDQTQPDNGDTKDDSKNSDDNDDGGYDYDY